jgi:hypothetical protein
MFLIKDKMIDNARNCDSYINMPWHVGIFYAIEEGQGLQRAVMPVMTMIIFVS